MTYADNYNIRTTSVKFNDVADALDGLITRNYAGLTTGTSTAYIATPTPAWDAYTTSGLVVIIPHVSNAGAATLNISSLGVRDLRIGGVAIAAGVLQQNVPAILAYTGTYFEVLLQSVSIPTGTIYTYAGASTPTGYLLCDGTAYNTYTYRTLHAVLSNRYGGTAYSAGTTDQPGAATTFLVPDLRRRTPVGRGASDTLGFTEGGNITGTTYASRTRVHSHLVPAHYHVVDSTVGSDLRIASSGSHTTAIDHDHASFNTSGSDGGHGHGFNLTALLGGDHSHTANFFNNITGAATARGYAVSGTTTSTIRIPVVGADGAHSHTVGGTVGGTDGTHGHAIDIPAFTANSGSTGAHTHATSDFTGAAGAQNTGIVGNTNGSRNGNSGFSSDPSGDPFLYVNFIIKT